MPNGELPKDVDGLQLNFCKTLACDNFGKSDAKHYVLQQVNPKRPAMVCRECGAFPPLLNNQEVINELSRLRQVHSDGLPACKNSECDNFGRSIHTYKHLYHSFGFSGERQRYRCKSCQSTFVDKWSGNNKKLAQQESLLALLFTGYSVREICRKLNINPKTFYDNLSSIASRCRRKLAVIDARWLNHTDHYHIASQFVALQPESHNGVFWMATGEANSGYILTQHINYSDQHTPVGSIHHNPYDEFCRFVPTTYTPEAVQPKNSQSLSLRERIDLKYQTILSRSNVEDPLDNLDAFQYPSKGALIRPPYTSYAHYMHILELCDSSKPLSLYMPQDPLLRSAALTICVDRIKQNSVDLMYVETDEGWVDNTSAKHADIIHMGWWRDRWAILNENGKEKGICYLAGNNPDPDYWLTHASTEQIAFFQERFQLLFKNFINEPRRKLRPGGILPLLDLFRAWHNLCYQDKNNQTAAQKLGLLAEPLTLKELLS